MNQVFTISEELNKALLDSQEYRQYVQALDTVKKQPELYQAMNDFRRRNRHIQMYASEETLFEENNQLVFEFDAILKNDAVETFLAAEKRFCRMMQTMYGLLSKDMEFDDEYLEG